MGLLPGLILVLIAIAPIHSAALPENAGIEVIEDFSGGLNTTYTRNKVPKSMSPYMRNVFVDEDSIKTIDGTTVVGSCATLQDGRFMFIFNKENSDKEFIVSDGATVLSTKDFLTYKTVITGLTRSVNLQMIQIRNKVWATNGSDPVFNYDGSTTVVLNGSTYGTLATPNIPRGKYIAAYQEKPFLFNVPDNNSALYWPNIAYATSGVSIAPDNVDAWPAVNSLNIGQGDGTPGSGLKVYRGFLYISKDFSIYKLQGKDVSDYFAIKTNAGIGWISQDCVTELDNLLHFQAKDGLYKFDGNDAFRITDLIRPDVQNFRSDSAKIVTNEWDTFTEFSKGQLSGATITAGGFVTMQTTNVVNLNVWTDISVVPGISSTSFNIDYTTSTEFVTWVPTFTLSSNFYGYFEGPMKFTGGFVSTGSSPMPTLITVIKNERTQEVAIASSAGIGAPNSWAEVTTDFYIHGESKLFFSGDDINSGNFKIKHYMEFLVKGTTINVQISTAAKSVRLDLAPSTTYQFISEITTASVLNSWGLFNAISNTNGGLINFFYKAATSTVNITTYPWISVSPGSVIDSSSTNKFIQWASTISSVFISNPANIDKATIEHIEGSGSNTRSFAVDWLGRWWPAISTEPTGNFPVIYVKARITNKNPDAWMPVEGINIRSMVRDNYDTFYAGSSTAGVFFRLDYGTNFSGQPIISTYQFPDLILSHDKYPQAADFYDKGLVSYLYDCDRVSGGILRIGTSIDGSDYSENTVSISGTGRQIGSVNNVNNGGKKGGKNFSFRVRQTLFDKPMNFHRFGVIFTPTDIR